VLKIAAAEAYEKGLAGPFMPHGVGHQLGLQVHDVGGHQGGPDGGEVPPPEAHPFLRNTRLLEPGHVVTIEPGLYFIPMLLEPWRQGPDAGLVDWDLVDRLTPLGGIRIEDNILCTENDPMDFTRPLLAGPEGE
jgi:Xaa-Pro dipeptidase